MSAGPRKRLRPRLELTISREALAVLSRLAGRGGSRSAVIERWLLSQAGSSSGGGKLPGDVISGSGAT